MKGLEEHIREQMSKYELPLLEHTYSTIEEFLDLNGLAYDTINDEQVRHYYDYRYNGLTRKWVNENLMTHESEKLMKKIREKFSDLIDKVYEDEYIKTKNNIVNIELNANGYDVFVKGSKDSTKLNSSNESEDLLKLVSFFNYYVSLVSGNTISLEPLFTKPCLSAIKRNGGKIYHCTLVSNLTRIMKLGIMPMVGKSKEESVTGYRYFPNKSFYIMNGKTNKETLDAIFDTLKDKELHTSKKYAIIEVDVSKLNLQFYLDEAAESKLAIYTFNAMDPRLITNIWHSFEEIKEYFENNGKHK